MAAEPPGDAEMIAQFDRVLTGMAYAASGLALFSIVWAGFVLMAEGSEERGSGRARAAVMGSVMGLVLVLSAKGITFALTEGRRHRPIGEGERHFEDAISNARARRRDPDRGDRGRTR